MCQFWVYSKILKYKILFRFFFLYRLLQDIECSSLGYIVGPCWFVSFYLLPENFILTYVDGIMFLLDSADSDLYCLLFNAYYFCVLFGGASLCGRCMES